MLKGLIKISPKHAAAKKVSIVTVCAKLGDKLSDRLTADGLVMGIALGGGLISYLSADAFCEKKDEEVKQVIAAIREHEIYPKIYRLANGNIEARKALGYRIDPRMWSAWEYVKMNARRLYDRYQQTDVTPSVFTPLVEVCPARARIQTAWSSASMGESTESRGCLGVGEDGIAVFSA